MTSLLPDIYKKSTVQEDEETIMIPDFHRPFSPSELQEENGTGEDGGSGPQIGEYFTRQEMEDYVAQKVERIRGTMREQVYRDTAAQKEQEIRDCLQQVDATLRDMEQEMCRFIEDYRDHLLKNAIEVAEKVVCRKIEEDDMFLVDLIKQAVNSVKNSEWITVGLSNKLSNLVEYLRKELKKADYGNAELAAGSYPMDACVLETSDGVLDASVSEQFRNMKQSIDGME